MKSPIQARFHLEYGDFMLNVDLELPGAGVTVLFGPSGSGKTSLLRCIAGLQTVADGYLSVDGEIWQDSARGMFLPTHRRPLGYVFQDANLFSHLNVSNNLLFGLRRLGKKQLCAEHQPILDLLDIGHLLKRMPERLSGGEKQRVAIARALLLKPSLLLMDEPLAALDYKRKQEILPFLTKLRRELNIPLLYVTHAQQELAQLADHLVVMELGKVEASGPLLTMLSRLDGPLADDPNAETVWPVKVISHDDDYALTQLGFAGGCLSLQRVNEEIGAELRARIHAREVSIVLNPPDRTSILNVFAATIDDLRDTASGQTLVRLIVGKMPLLAHITRKSAVGLGLSIGMRVYAQVKGTSILN